MKITTNNSLAKLLELLKEKVIQLQNYIAQKPNIDDNTPRSSAVYSSQKVQAIVDTNTVQINELETAVETKPSIDDNTPSNMAVYSSSKVEELISNKIVTIALKIGWAEWQQDVYDNYYVEKDLSDQLAQYSFSSSNFSMMVNIDESSAVSPIWSNIKVSRVGNILRFESSVAIEYTVTVFVEVWENKLEGEQPLYAFKKNTEDLIGVSGGVIYKELDIIGEDFVEIEDETAYKKQLTTEDWTNKVCFVDGIYATNASASDHIYNTSMSNVYRGYLEYDSTGTYLILFVKDKVYLTGGYKFKVVLFDKAESLNALIEWTPDTNFVSDTNSVFINNSSDIKDDIPSDYTTYSSSKIESLLENVGGGKATFIGNAYLGNTQWVAEGDYFTQTFTLGEGDLSDKACIIDLRACDNNQEAYEHDLAEYAKIVKAELVYGGTYTSIKFTAKEALSGDGGNLGLKVLLIDATDGVSTYAPDGGGSTNTYESGKCFLTNRAPVNSGGSTVYEISPLLNLYMFNDNNDDDIPYYSDITQLSSYGINENMKAVIIPTTDNDKASTLKYTECLSNGNIRCYFKENPTGYKIQAIEITPIKKITYYNKNDDKTGN